MTRIAAEVTAHETTRKQAESEATRGDEIEMLTEQLNVQQPIPPHDRRSAEEVSFSEPYHQGAGIGWQVQYHECAGHQRQVVVGTEIPLRSRFRIVLHCRRLNGRSNVRAAAKAANTSNGWSMTRGE
jgi:hypothetical protein